MPKACPKRGREFLVSEDEELPPLEYEVEVTDVGMNRQQLPVNGAVSGIHQLQLPQEEGEWSPGGAAKVL